MFALFRFVISRVVRRAGRRSRWVSRLLLVVGMVRMWNSRPRGRTVLTVGRGETLVVGVEGSGRQRP